VVQPPALTQHAAPPHTHRRPKVQAGHRLLLGVVHPRPLCRGQPVRRPSLHQPVWRRRPAALICRRRAAPHIQWRGRGGAQPAAGHKVRQVRLPGLPSESTAGGVFQGCCLQRAAHGPCHSGRALPQPARRRPPASSAGLDLSPLRAPRLCSRARARARRRVLAHQVLSIGSPCLSRRS
jgi:hypothetical protein